jgi:integrase
MSPLQQTVEDYLALRRSLGYKLETDGRRLFNFAAFLDREDSPVITTRLALAWATRPAGISAQTAARRLAIVRRFAEFVCTLDPRTEVPPSDSLPYRKTRSLPYVYSRADVQALIRGIEVLRAPRFRRSTFSTLIGLLVVTGMRVGEAIGLDRSDFDRRKGVLTIREGKFGKSREVPLHSTARAALRRYERERDRRCLRPDSLSFFISMAGSRLHRQNVSLTFTRVLRRAGLLDRKPRRPRIHDLRHTFAVNTLIDWYRAGLDVETQIPLLSTYLGHVSPSSTYWYLSAVPELVGRAAERLECAWGEAP